MRFVIQKIETSTIDREMWKVKVADVDSERKVEFYVHGVLSEANIAKVLKEELEKRANAERQEGQAKGLIGKVITV